MATKADLQKALDEANAGHGPDDQIVPDGTNKPDLEAALAAAGVEVTETDAKPAVLVVRAPLVQAKVGGRILHFYAGDLIPAGTDADSVANLKSLGYVEDIDAPESDAK